MNFEVKRISNYLKISINGKEEELLDKKESIDLAQKMLETVSSILYYANVESESNIASSLSDILNNYK